MLQTHARCVAPQRTRHAPFTAMCSHRDVHPATTHPAQQNTTWHPASIALAAAACLSLSLSPLVSPAHAVSGGKGISSSLAFSDQSGKDLRGVQLTKADLRGTNFSKSDLSNSILFGALAEGADFSFSILRESDLEGYELFPRGGTSCVHSGVSHT